MCNKRHIHTSKRSKNKLETDGRALLPTQASPSTFRFSNRTSIAGKLRQTLIFEDHAQPKKNVDNINSILLLKQNTKQYMIGTT